MRHHLFCFFFYKRTKKQKHTIIATKSENVNGIITDNTVHNMVNFFKFLATADDIMHKQQSQSIILNRADRVLTVQRSVVPFFPGTIDQSSYRSEIDIQFQPMRVGARDKSGPIVA